MNNNNFIKSSRHSAYASIVPYLQDDSVEISVKHKLVKFLLGQGGTHSNKHTGIFNDQYLRDGNIVEVESSLVYKAITILNNNYGNKAEYYLPVICSKHALTFLPQLSQRFPVITNSSIIKIKFVEREINCLKVTADFKTPKSELLNQLIKFLGNRGLLPVRDTMLYILVSHLCQNWQQQNYVTECSNIDLQRSACFAARALEDLAATIRKPKNNLLQSSTYEFYQQFNLNFLAQIFEADSSFLTNCSKSSLSLVNDSLLRIGDYSRFGNNFTGSYAEFILAQEFIFDEICLILVLLDKYQVKDFISAAKKYLIQSFDLKLNAKYLQVALTGSCMHAANINYQAAIEYCAKKFDRPLSVLVGVNSYHEIPESWGLIADYTNNRLVTVANNQVINSQNYLGQIADVLLLSPNDNVNHKVVGFGCSDLHAIIDQQLDLRAQQKNTAQFFVLLDLTLTNLTDVQLDLLFNVYAPQIVNGQIAFMLAYSLNKYFQVGFDRSAAGLSACLYSKQHFAGLNCTSGFLGFNASDISAQLITHMLKTSTSFIDQYYDMVHGLSRYIHDVLIPPELYIAGQAISIDKPYTDDVYKNPWAFLVIRFLDANASRRYEEQLTSFLSSIGISFRDGFGFNQSTFIVIEQAVPPIVRISIGPDAASEQFLLLVDFIVNINTQHLQHQNLQRTIQRPRF